jgi:hypothetical protein
MPHGAKIGLGCGFNGFMPQHRISLLHERDNHTSLPITFQRPFNVLFECYFD